MKYIIYIFIFFLFGCNSVDFGKNGLSSELNGKYYSTRGCYKELSLGNDIIQNGIIDKIIVYKSKRKMELYKNNNLIDTIPISLGKNPIGHKIRRGDNRTPEGKYYINRKKCSKEYYRSLGISYPSSKDIKEGVNVGGGIMIHGQLAWNADGKANEYTLSKDWTRGCIAITNKDMQKIWYEVQKGVVVYIKK